MIAYGPNTGATAFNTYASQELTDRSSLSVNVASGALFLANQDAHLDGFGLDFTAPRYFNSYRSGPTWTNLAGMGAGWSLGTGRGIWLERGQDGDMIYNGPTGAPWYFLRTGSNTWADAPGLDASLTVGGYFYLTLHPTGTKLAFNCPGSCSDQGGLHPIDRTTTKVNFPSRTR